jgi:hypothetical protein
MNRRAKVCLTATAAAVAWLVAPVPPCHAQEMEAAYVRLDAASYEEFDAAVQFIEDQGAVLRHRFYPYAAMGEIVEGSEILLGGTPAIRDVFVGEISSTDMLSLTKYERYLAKAYNDIYFPSGGKERPYSSPSEANVPIDFGPRTIPPEYMDSIKAAGAARGVPPPLSPATSEFMLGSIAVGVILPESQPGFGTQDWVSLEEQTATEKVISAMDWWARHSPNQELRFNYEINYAVPVYTEPMDKGGDEIEATWAGQSFTSLGYQGSNYFAQAYSYVYTLKERYKTDWAFIVFVLHGNPGQQFGGNVLAYAYLGGPFNVNVYSNGSLGPDKLDRIIAHESGHIFYTLDEYPNTYATCTSRSGYLNVENANQQQGGSGCKSDVPCVMRGGSQPTPFDVLDPCYFTCGQVGWWDSDEDGIPDILDTDPAVTSVVVDTAEVGGIVSGDTLLTVNPSFKGTVRAVPIPNENPYSMASQFDFTVEPVSAEYRVDGGPWLPCVANDGRFDESVEGYRFTAEGLAPWSWHTIDVRAVTAHGNVTPEISVGSTRWYIRPAPTGSYVWLASANPSSLPVHVSFSPGHASGRSGVLVPVEVAVYDVTGRKLRTLRDADFQSGRLYKTEWDGTNDDGQRMPAGVYFIGIVSQGRSRADKVIVIP